MIRPLKRTSWSKGRCEVCMARATVNECWMQDCADQDDVALALIPHFWCPIVSKTNAEKLPIIPCLTVPWIICIRVAFSWLNFSWVLVFDINYHLLRLTESIMNLQANTSSRNKEHTIQSARRSLRRIQWKWTDWNKHTINKFVSKYSLL